MARVGPGWAKPGLPGFGLMCGSVRFGPVLLGFDRFCPVFHGLGPFRPGWVSLSRFSARQCWKPMENTKDFHEFPAPLNHKAPRRGPWTLLPTHSPFFLYLPLLLLLSLPPASPPPLLSLPPFLLPFPGPVNVHVRSFRGVV